MPQGLGALPLFRQFLEEEGVVVRDHRGARARGAHHVIEALLLEDLEEVARHPAGLVEKPGVEGRLAAARLPLGVDHLDAEPPQDTYHAYANFRVYEIYVARYEQGHPHRSKPLSSLVSPNCLEPV